MAWIAINGVELPVLLDGASIAHETIGETARAESGELLSSRRGVKRTFSVEVAPLKAEEALFLRDLALGLLDTWQLASHLYSHKGRLLTVSGAGLIGDLGHWDSPGELEFGSVGNYCEAPFDCSRYGATVLVWVEVGGAFRLEVASYPAISGASDKHYSVSTAGVVSTSSWTASNWAGSAAAPRLVRPSGGSAFSVSWLTILPRSLDGLGVEFLEDMLSGFGSAAIQPPLAPRLNVTGDVVDPSAGASPYAICLGGVDGVRLLQLRRDGSTDKTSHLLSLRFEEV